MSPDNKDEAKKRLQEVIKTPRYQGQRELGGSYKQLTYVDCTPVRGPFFKHKIAERIGPRLTLGRGRLKSRGVGGVWSDPNKSMYFWQEFFIYADVYEIIAKAVWYERDCKLLEELCTGSGECCRALKGRGRIRLYGTSDWFIPENYRETQKNTVKEPIHIFKWTESVTLNYWEGPNYR